MRVVQLNVTGRWVNVSQGEQSWMRVNLKAIPRAPLHFIASLSVSKKSSKITNWEVQDAIKSKATRERFLCLLNCELQNIAEKILNYRWWLIRFFIILLILSWSYWYVRYFIDIEKKNLFDCNLAFPFKKRRNKELNIHSLWAGLKFSFSFLQICFWKNLFYELV